MAWIVAAIRFFLFCIFFAVGAGAIALSILVEEIDNLYQSHATVERIETSNAELEKLIGEADLQLENIREDPNLLARLRWLTLGEEPEAADTVFPEAADTQVRQAADAILAEHKARVKQQASPEWVQRCVQPRVRYSLFFAGAGLVLVNFIFFGAGKAGSSRAA